MIDPKAILDQFLGANVPGTQSSVAQTAGKAKVLARDNPLATGALAAILLGTGTGRQFAGSALKLGGLAAVAGLGYQAWKNYQAGNAPTESQSVPKISGELAPPPPESGFSGAPERLNDGFALALIRVMIGAARADGHIDGEEQARIHEKLVLSGLGDQAVAFLDKEISSPVDIDALVAEARSDEQKVELFTAARLAIEPNTRAERGYLDLIAGRLGLPDALVDHIEATVSSAKA